MAYVILLILLSAALLLLFAVWALSSYVVRPKTTTKDKSYAFGVKNGDFDPGKYEALPKYSFSFSSKLGYPLQCLYLPRPAGCKPTDGRERGIVLAHGFTVNKELGIRYAMMFHQLGFSCLLYDHRNHGESGKAPTTMGWYEAQDLAAMVAWMRRQLATGDPLTAPETDSSAFCKEEHPMDSPPVVGVHGESMGAATALMSMALPSPPDFVIEDCGYSNLLDQMAHVLSTQFHLPRWLLTLSLPLLRRRGRFEPCDVRPSEAAAKGAGIPLLILHGEQDNYVPTRMAEEIYQAAGQPKTKVIFAGARHGGSFSSDRPRYAAEVQAFLAQNNLIPPAANKTATNP